jgi:predicted DNA-binding transcriptional regulator YafY
LPSAARLFALLELLESSPVVSGAEIADRLRVDRRTVRRDVQALQDLGIPVVGTRGAGGGYRLRPGFRLPPLMLSADEATAAVLGLSASRRLALGDPEAAGSALGKLRRVLPDALRLQTEALEAVTAFRARSPGAAPAPTGTVLLLAEAIFRRRRVRMRYESFDGRRSERELSPFGLVVGERFWYLAAHDHGRGALRTFRVDRIGSPELLSAAGQAPPEGFDSAEHVERSLHEVPWRWSVRVRLDLPVDEARRRIAGSLARTTVDEQGGGTLLSLGAESLDWVASLLAGLGCAFEVLEPAPELREALERLAQRLLAA